MKIDFDQKFKRKLKKINKTDKETYQKFLVKLELLQTKPSHISLRLHKIGGKKIESWSISATRKVRVLFVMQKDGILLTDIGSHDEVY